MKRAHNIIAVITTLLITVPEAAPLLLIDMVSRGCNGSGKDAGSADANDYQRHETAICS